MSMSLPRKFATMSTSKTSARPAGRRRVCEVPQATPGRRDCNWEKQDGMGPADKVQQRNQRQAGQCPAEQVGAIELGNPRRMARKDERKQQSGDEKRNEI